MPSLFRNNCVRDWVDRIEKYDGGLNEFSQGYKYYGLHFQPDNSVIAREWAPGAVQLYLTGDFSKCYLLPATTFYKKKKKILSHFIEINTIDSLQTIGNGKQRHSKS